MPDHLTRTPAGLVFQIRIPKALDPGLSFAPIRVTLGHVRIREARRLAAQLAGAAHLAFGHLQRNAAEGGKAIMTDQDNVGRAVRDHLTALLPVLRGLDGVGRLADGSAPASSAAIAGRMAETGLNGLIGIAADRISGASALVAAEAPVLDRYYLGLVTDEGATRAHLGLPPLAPTAPASAAPARNDELAGMLRELMASQAALQAQIAGMAPQEQDRGSLFSEASRTYQDKLRNAHGADYGELSYLRHRTDVFLAFMEDKPVGRYTQDDLQAFIDQVAYMPANASKDDDYDMARIREIVEDNRKLARRPLSRSTLKNNYVGKIKTIIRAGCRQAQIPFQLDDLRLIYPKISPPKRQRTAPDYELLNQIFAKGVASGELTKALLPLTGFVTGRRIGLLSFLRGENIRRYHGVWIAIPPNVITVDGSYQIVPYKTQESLSFFVLHNFLDEIGFIDWARRREGFIFPSLHEGVVDPADTAQKRMGRLFRAAGASPHLLETYHSLRTAKINFDRDLKIDPRTTRLQVGHELLDVHEEYGGSLRRSELHEIAKAPLPTEIDFTVFRGLDFDGMAANRPSRGRPKRIND
ncbi:hypothetical protein [Microvirga guangxiensis]|uniref:Uncharacterized protein n=1 Tax=Microvirga guangxiensis TaxID=549386 RepID=A0A1G5F5X8_9HYPH|nr:hypothetical protein [Microvirga guangxiensis]SCY34645.1 hypothetical protein SAMN02927923_01232 [Microvirga guangxiensis]